MRALATEAFARVRQNRACGHCVGTANLSINALRCDAKNGKTILKIAVIPARGGSKRIPRKNIKSFAGKPIIAWPIEAALKVFDDVIVSTDDEEIAQIVRALGANVPFMRTAELANDHAATIPVIAHGIDAYEQTTGSKVDIACCIYATAAFVTADMLNDAMSKLKDDINYVMPIAEFPAPIQRAIRVDGDRLGMFNPEKYYFRSQDLERAFYDPGQFYVGRADAWRRGEIMYSKNAIGIEVSSDSVEDIDTLQDWLRAEEKFLRKWPNRT